MKLDKSDITKKELPFEYNKLYELWINSEYIQLHQETIDIIIKSIVTEYVLSGRGMEAINIVSLLNDIEWQWMATSGSLTKRIGKWMKQYHGLAISSELSTAIGNTARKFLLKNQTYYFDFVDKIEWKAGNFGDHDSCFWTGTRESRSILKRISDSETMGAVRLFKQHSTVSGFETVPDNAYYKNDKCYYTGISRAWMSIDKHQNSRIYTVFNGYGLTTIQIAALVSSFLGMSTRHLAVNDKGNVEGDLYINNFGIAIGDNSVIKNIEEYDINIDGVGSFYEKPVKREKRSRQIFLDLAIRKSYINPQVQLKYIKHLRTGKEPSKEITLEEELEKLDMAFTYAAPVPALEAIDPVVPDAGAIL